MSAITQDQLAFVSRHRVARLATTGPKGDPHIVPVCFAIADESVYIALDDKPKQTPLLQLKRVRNIRGNPRVCLLVDRYSNNWSQLAWVRLDGRAALLLRGTEHDEALRLLRERYPQYETMLPEDAPVITVHVERVSSWGRLKGGSGPT